MGWSEKYKKSIDCNNPKGFSQKAHCAGRKKKNEEMNDNLKEIIINILSEGVDDPGILKCIFMAGGPGSGKSYTAKEIFGVGKKLTSSFSASGLKLVNSDTAFEKGLKDNGINPKDLAKIEKEDPELWDKITGKDSIRSKAKALTQTQQRFYEAGRLGMIIDGTGDEVSKIKKKKQHAEKLGYDCYMVFVNTSLEVALERNNARDRVLPEDLVTDIWKACQDNLGKFQTMFSGNFVIVDNTVYKPINNVVQKQVDRFIRKPIYNAIGKKWIQNARALKRAKLIRDNKSHSVNENFPNMKQWWKEDKKKVMSFIYFLQRQTPPSNKDKYEKAWIDVVKQLQKKNPAPNSIYKKIVGESVNEAAITYGIEYKSSKNDRKFKKASLTKTTHNPNIDKMMIKAISKDAKSLAKQDGWVDYRITKDGVPVKESVNEAKEPEVISQLRDIVKGKQNKKIKDPKSGKMMRVDLYSASAITKVYDAINKSNKDKFGKLSLPKMVNVAFSVIKKESVNEGKFKPSQVRSAISKVKKGLMRKWKQKGGYENFGQKELSQMKDKFDYNAYGDKDERDISHMLDAFDNWAMNYDGNMREAYVVLYSPKKGVKPVTTAAYADKKDAEKWAKDLGGITMIVKKKVKGIDEGVEPHIRKTADILKLNPKTVEKFASKPTPNGPINMVKVLKLAKMANDAGKRNLIKYIKGEAPATNKKSYDKHLAESVNEARRSVVHKAAKKGSFPVSLVVVKNGKVIDQELVKTPEAVPAAFNVIQSKHKGAIVHIEDKTGKRLFSESVDEKMDLNDPMLVKLRAAQIKRNQQAADRLKKAKSDKEKEKAEKLAKRNATKIKALKKKRADIMRDMEQEAEPEGGKIADRYGKMLNKIDNDIIKLGGNPMTNEERINLFVEKNVPTNPSKWAYYKAQAKKKFDVYPSAYANGWAAKKYKAAGGGWRKEK